MSESTAEQKPRSRFFAQLTDLDVIAHRGGDGQWPGETIFAFTEATKGDADVIEMDVWGTADKIPVLVLAHSSNLTKMTEGDQKLPDATYAEIKDLNAAYRWSPDGGKTFPFRNAKPTLTIARLEEVFEKFRDKRMNIEIKQKRPSIVEPLLELIKGSKVPTDNLLIASFYTDVLKEFRARCKERNLQIATSASTWEWLKFYFGSYLFRLRYKPSTEAIQMAERIPLLGFWLLTRGLVRRAHEFGLKVHAWTVNDPDDMRRAIAAGVDGIVTDFPGPLRAILTEQKSDKALTDESGPFNSRLLNAWTRFREKVGGLFSILRVVRFSLAMVLLPAIAFIFIPQGQEALRILAKEPGHLKSQVVAFIGSLMLLTFMAWYWASILVDVLRPGARSEPGPQRWAARQLPRICGIIPLLAISIALLVAAKPVANPSNTETADFTSSPDSRAGDLAEQSDVKVGRPAVEVKNSRGRFLLLALFSALFTFPIYAIFYFRRYLLQKHDSQLVRPVAEDRTGKKQLSVRHLPGLSKLALMISILVWLALFLVFIFQTGDRPITIAQSQAFGPVAIALFFAAVWVPFGSLLVFWSETYKIPLFTLLFVLAAAFSIGDVNDNHKIRELGQRTPPPALKTAFKKWLNERCDRDRYSSYPVFIVSAEGGGLRTAYFTSLVLSAAQDRNKEFAHHVFAISGVSGGSVGATVFTALADKYVHKTTGTPCTFSNDLPTKKDGNQNTMQDMTNEILGQDLLSPVLASALYPDLIQRFLFWPVHRFDRARSLEDGLRQSWENATGKSPEFSNHSSFYNLSQNNANQSTPALFLNTTHVESGQRMVVSSLDLSGEDGTADSDLSGLVSINHIRNVYPPNIDLPLGTAAFLSARFPLITPAGFICQENDQCRKKSRYVDGGYFENSGTATLADILSALQVDVCPNPAQQNVKLIVINIGTDPRDVKYRAVGLGEITAPIFAVLNTRTARGDTATQQLETAISKVNSRRESQATTAPANNTSSSTNDMAEVIHFQTYEHEVQLPTGWLLSADARQNMECQLGISTEEGNKKCSDTLLHVVRTKPRKCLSNRKCLPQVGEVLKPQK